MALIVPDQKAKDMFYEQLKGNKLIAFADCLDKKGFRQACDGYLAAHFALRSDGGRNDIDRRILAIHSNIGRLADEYLMAVHENDPEHIPGALTENYNPHLLCILAEKAMESAAAVYDAQVGKQASVGTGASAQWATGLST